MAISFEEFYKNLIIIQYKDNKPKASAEVRAIVANYKPIYDDIISLLGAFDIDTATGKQLDILGDIVGQSRIILNLTPIQFFGLGRGENVDGFGGTFHRKGTPLFSDESLATDSDYRLFVKARIVVNNNDGTISNIQQLINFIFTGATIFEVANGLGLEVKREELNLLKKIIAAKLLPKPAGINFVRFQHYKEPRLGFNINPKAEGFGSFFVRKYLP